MDCSLIVSDFSYDLDNDFDDDFFSDNRTPIRQLCNCSDPKHWYVDFCDCDYPIDESLTKILDYVLVVGFFYAVVLIIGLTGNLTIIYAVVRFRCLRTLTNIFLASLASSDLFLLLFCIPIQYLKYVTHTWLMGSFLCSFVHYVQMFSMICSVLTLTAISIERYLAIARPVKAYGSNSTGRARKTICLIWITSLILALPDWFTFQTETFLTKRQRTATWCSRWYPEPVHVFEKVFVLYQTVVLFAVPLVTMAYCYFKICCILYSTEQDFDRSPNPLQRKRRQRLERGTACKDSEFTMIDRAKATEGVESGSLLRKITESGSIPEEFRLKLENPRITKLGVAGRYHSRRSFGGNSEQNSKQVIRMLLTIVTLFIISWSPYLIDDFLVAFGLICGQSNSQLLKHIRMASALLVYSNACQNPIVYAFMSSQFEQIFGDYYRKACCPWRTKRDRRGMP